MKLLNFPHGMKKRTLGAILTTCKCPAAFCFRVFLKMLIANELTDMQRICATAYWLEGEKQKDIASHLGLHKSTVSRHIKAAKKKLQNVAQYYD